jgi:hypothetical protein
MDNRLAARVKFDALFKICGQLPHLTGKSTPFNLRQRVAPSTDFPAAVHL